MIVETDKPLSPEAARRIKDAFTANIVRFHRRGFRKGRCDICAALVATPDVKVHARWHIRRGERTGRLAGTLAAYCDVEVYDDHEVASGWLTTDNGPR